MISPDRIILIKINKRDKKSPRITGGINFSAKMKLSEFIYKESQTRFVSVGIFSMYQSVGCCFIDNLRYTMKFRSGGFFISFITQFSDSVTKFRTKGTVADSLFGRSFHPFGTRLMIWQQFILSNNLLNSNIQYKSAESFCQ